MDPSTAPDGQEPLRHAAAIIPGATRPGCEYLWTQFEEFEADLTVMYPGLAQTYWRRRHLVHDPSFGVIQKPGLVGIYRPHWRAPNVEGLWFAPRRSAAAGSASTGPRGPG